MRDLGRVLEDGNVTWEYSRTLRERTGYPGETSAKLTSDVRAKRGVKHRQVLAIGQDADVT